MQKTTTQIYLEITPEHSQIRGEAQAGGYENRIELDSFSFDAKTKTDTLKDISDLNGKPNLDLNHVTLSRAFDNSSLKLAGLLKGRQEKGAEREGERFTLAKLSVDQQYIESYSADSSEKYANEILILNLYDGHIARISYRIGEAGAGAEIKEEIELSFHDFEIVYYAEDRTGAGKLADTWRPLRLSYMTNNRADQKA